MKKKKRETEGPIPTNDDETMMKCTTCVKELLVSYLGLKVCVTDEEPYEPINMMSLNIDQKH